MPIIALYCPVCLGSPYLPYSSANEFIFLSFLSRYSTYIWSPFPFLLYLLFIVSSVPYSYWPILLAPGHLHPLLDDPRLTCPGRESSLGPPRWEASTLAQSYSNSLLLPIRNIYMSLRHYLYISSSETFPFFHKCALDFLFLPVPLFCDLRYLVSYCISKYFVLLLL
jgi:hypothetical protein